MGICLVVVIPLWVLLPKEWWDDGAAQAVALMVSLPLLILNRRITWEVFGALSVFSIAIGAINGTVGVKPQLFVTVGSVLMLIATWWLADRHPADAVASGGANEGTRHL
jgi:hypothetical protein